MPDIGEMPVKQMGTELGKMASEFGLAVTKRGDVREAETGQFASRERVEEAVSEKRELESMTRDLSGGGGQRGAVDVNVSWDVNVASTLDDIRSVLTEWLNESDTKDAITEIIKEAFYRGGMT